MGTSFFPNCLRPCAGGANCGCSSYTNTKAFQISAAPYTGCSGAPCGCGSIFSTLLAECLSLYSAGVDWDSISMGYGSSTVLTQVGCSTYTSATTTIGPATINGGGFGLVFLPSTGNLCQIGICTARIYGPSDPFCIFSFFGYPAQCYAAFQVPALLTDTDYVEVIPDLSTTFLDTCSNNTYGACNSANFDATAGTLWETYCGTCSVGAPIICPSDESPPPCTLGGSPGAWIADMGACDEDIP